MRHPQSFDIEKEEFLCPLCRCLSNAVIPLIPQFHLLQPITSTANSTAAMPQVTLDLSQWLQALMITLKYKKELTEPSAAAAAAAAAARRQRSKR